MFFCITHCPAVSLGVKLYILIFVFQDLVKFVHQQSAVVEKQSATIEQQSATINHLSINARRHSNLIQQLMKENRVRANFIF